MQVLSAQLKNLPILSLQTGQVVAHLAQPIINYQNLEVVGFFCISEEGEQVILNQSITHLTPSHVIIHHQEELSNADDIVRLKDLIEKQFKLVGLPVVNDMEVKLGKVSEYAINIKTFLVQKLHVKSSPLRNPLVHRLVIDRVQIVEVTPERILVKDTRVKKPLITSAPILSE